MQGSPRSWLFMPANRPDRYAKALTTDAGAFILDLEDSVPDEQKESARDAIRASAETFAGFNAWIRVNATDSAWRAADLQLAVQTPHIGGVWLPKVESADDIPSAGQLTRADGTRLGIALLIESARGVLNLHSILTARGEVAAVMFGGAQGADLMLDLGCAWSIDGPELLHARQHTLLAIRAARTVQAVDGVFASLDDDQGLEQDTTLSRRLGYRARAVVHPAQIVPVNAIYAPQAQELEWARKVEQAFLEASGRGLGAVRLDGKMIDRAMYALARKILDSEI